MSETPASQDNADSVAFEQVTKGFASRKVLDGVSFSVPRGEALCIMGRSGTGKSVTLKLMIGLMKADNGKVLVQGKNMSELDEDGLIEVRRTMGFMFQNAALFDIFNLYDNLALPMRRLRKDKSRQEVDEAVKHNLEQVGLAKDGVKMPNALSGGMLKRAGLARALVLEPEILLVDEPSSGLDRITSSEIDDLLLKIKTERHTTMVIVTHDIEGARKIANKLAILDQGKLVGFGTPEELENSDNDVVKRLVAGA